MTIKNAIKELEDFQIDIGSCYDDVNLSPLYYALDMAIEALENPVLDKIRAEIEKEADTSNRLYGISEIGLRKALKIIDKYKAESEEKNE